MVGSISSRLKRAITGQLVAGQDVGNVIARVGSKKDISRCVFFEILFAPPCG